MDRQKWMQKERDQYTEREGGLLLICSLLSSRRLSSLCANVSVYPPIIARQRLGKNVTVATNTHTKIEELLDVSLYMWSISYQTQVDHYLV
jgi:hypothetical protein